ncbi:hypothetical protein GCM10025857_31600 [Alicyclobacillus contaminans]|uniref:hypothetical protein n=1 Tax=Alicyclobacillus contaminans TaxID=392016 RepID=UPI00040E457C|nr:hypothetical protein [Alicyclobacillus contaminans]GMA51803.1 hypothetical protein GCM10025857_31600 [Alicyclobacillus contaminans]
MLIHSIGDKQRLSAVHRQYQCIMQSHLSTQQRDMALASLMTQMEREFHIPLLRDEQWEQRNKPVIALYRIISESRKQWR